MSTVATQKLVKLTRVHPHGNGRCVLLTKAILDDIGWQNADSIAVRRAGDKLVLERIPLDSFAKLRTGEPAADVR